MFTGLVEGIGDVRSVRNRSGMRELVIHSPFPPGDLRAGASIAVHGVCLTLTEDGGRDGSFRVQAAAETLRRTTLGRLRTGDRVHLERALRAGDRLGGHIVQGHVDGLGRIVSRRRGAGEWVLEVALPPRLAPYVVEKGSISIDGVSLTVGRMRGGRFSVHLIPATVDATLFARYRPGRSVNLEVDLVAKYVESVVRPLARSGLA